MTIYASDPQLYDTIYGGDDNDALAFVRWLFGFLGFKPEDDRTILDMGSGTGNLLIPLTKDGYNIKGREPFKMMRDYGIAKSKVVEVDIDLSEGSFETLEDEGAYDLITAINGPLHYVEPEDLYDVMGRLSRALRPGGHVVFDLINFLSIIKNYDKPDLEEFEMFDEPANAMIQHFVDLDREKWINRVVLFFKDQEYQRFEDIQEMSMYTKTNLDMIAGMNGLEQAHLFCSYDDRPDERVYGGRLITVYRKTAVETR